MQSAARRWRPRAITAALTLLVVASAAGWNALRPGEHPGPATPSQDRVAVFPLVLSAAAPSDTLLGLVASQMLSSALDGAGALRTADVGAAGSLARILDAGAARPRTVQHVATRLGAGRFVLGRLLITGDRVLVTAALYQTGLGRAGPARVADVSVEGERAAIDALVAELAIRLLRVAHGLPPERPGRSPARAARSLHALRSFLAGESHFRAGRYSLAVDAYHRAVLEDSALAIAYYRMAIAADWSSRPVELQAALAGAERFRARLPYRERSLVDGILAWHRGRAAEAERHYRALVTQHPGDAEAWYQLCEVQFHMGPLDGRPVLDALHACERALEYTPGGHEALVHLFRLAAKARDGGRMASVARQLLARATPAESVAVMSLHAFTTGDPARQARAVAALGQSADETLLHAAIKVGVYAEDLPGAQRIAALLLRAGRGPAYQVTGALYVALLEAARGRRRPSDSSFRLAEGGLGTSAVAFRALVASAPLQPTSREELRALRDSVHRWIGGGDGREPDPGHGWPLLEPRFGSWVAGLLSARLGDPDAVVASARSLERVSESTADAALARDLARTLRAEAARLRGEPARALALLTAETSRDRSPGSLGTVVGSGVYQRFLRAELLRELGRDDEALEWYRSIGGVSVPELPFLAASYHRQAEILDRAGDRAGAAEGYRRFVELWRDCDPELRPLVVAAERRLEEMAGR